MLTWNFQYISKKRLAIAFDQLMLRPENGDILVRIHTAIHTESEAVELAKFISALVPGAHIFGTSTSAVINGGKLLRDLRLPDFRDYAFETGDHGSKESQDTANLSNYIRDIFKLNADAKNFRRRQFACNLCR